MYNNGLMDSEVVENNSGNKEKDVTGSTAKKCRKTKTKLPDSSNVTDGEENENSVKTGKFSCKLCSKSLSTSHNLRRHITRFHEGNQELIKETMSGGQAVCLECGDRFVQVVYLRKHLVEKHGFQYDEYEIHFENMEDFETWKKEMEERTNSGYSKKAKKNVFVDGSFSMYFHCNRSGIYRSKVDDHARKRKMKANGTIKINMSCTSWIKVFQDAFGKVSAKFVSTHYGHDAYVKAAAPKRQRTKTASNKTKNDNNSGKKRKSKKNESCSTELLNSVENETNISTLKHELMTELWEISCRVEKCTSRETLLFIKDEIRKAKELL